MLEKIKNNKLKSVVVGISFMLFIVGLAVSIKSTGGTYAVEQKCWNCGTTQGNRYVLGTTDMYGSRCAEVDDSYCSSDDSSDSEEYSACWNCGTTQGNSYVFGSNTLYGDRCNQVDDSYCNDEGRGAGCYVGATSQGYGIPTWYDVDPDLGNDYQHFTKVDDEQCNDDSTEEDSDVPSTPVTPATYTVSYDANGGSGAPQSQTKVEDVSLTLSSTVPTRTGYTFLGWATSKTATSSEYHAGGSYTSNAGVTLFAVWKANTYTLSYDANGGSEAPASQTGTYGSSISISTEKPTKVGYTFTGWNTKRDGTGTKIESSYSITSNVTLYAQYKANQYKIAYTANGGVVTGLPNVAVYDNIVEIKNPTKTVTVIGNVNKTDATVSKIAPVEQRFAGWTSSTIDTTSAYYGGTAWTDKSTLVTDTKFKNLTTVDNGTVTLVANWTAVDITLPTVTKEGYTCNWNTKSDGKGDSYASGGKYIPTVNSDSSINLYAICEVNSKADEEVTENTKTGDALIVTAWIVGIGALGYSVYYLRSRKFNI